MANNQFERLLEKMTQRQPELGDNPLGLWERIRKSNLERFGNLKAGLESAITRVQRRISHWDHVSVRYLNSDTVVIEKAEGPYIRCTLRLVDDNIHIQGTVEAAKCLPDPDAIVKESISIRLTSKNGKPAYSLNGKTFSSVDSLSYEILETIQNTVNQDPALVKAVAAKQSFDADMKRGLKAIDTEWNRNLKARKKRDARANRKRDTRAGRWP